MADGRRLDENCFAVPHDKPFRYKEDGYDVTRTIAWSGPGCHNGCGVLLYAKDGKLEKVEGDPDHPFNQGRLCCRCLAVPECVNHEDRLRYPMIRDPKDRGDHTKWKRISWDEAYDIIEEKLTYFKENFGAESVSFWKGTGRDIVTYLSRFAWAYGSPNFTSPINGIACYLPRVFGGWSTAGAFFVGDYSQQFPDRYDNPNWKCPELILVWGNNPLKSNSDGLFGPWITDCMQRGARVITIDPKVTWIASRSDMHLQIRPGTDCALAMGMANIIIQEDLYDHEFVDCWCYGFEEFAERAAQYDVKRVSEITWIPEEEIIECARRVAKADGMALQWGVAIDQTKEALPGSTAMFNIAAITGNLERPGGWMIPPDLLFYIAGWGPELLPPEQKEKMLGLQEYPFYRSGVTNASDQLILKACETGEPYVQKCAWIQTTDIINGAGPDPVRAEKALRMNEFNIGIDLFMTVTMNKICDIVLPAATFPERDGIYVGSAVQPGETINKAVDGGEVKSDMEIILEMGHRLCPDAFPWKDCEEMYTHIFEPTGLTFKEIQEDAPIYLPFEYYKYKKGLLRPDGQPGFNTATGRIELWSSFYAGCGLDPLPEFEEPEPSPYSTPEIYEDMPLIIVTGVREIMFFHSENRNQEHLRALMREPFLEIHPDTAKKYGVADGDWVWVEGIYGRAKRQIKTTPCLDPRVVSTCHGWSHPEAGVENNYDIDDLNINRLLDWDHVGKTGVGSNYKSSLCKIYKVTEGDEHND